MKNRVVEFDLKNSPLIREAMELGFDQVIEFEDHFSYSKKIQFIKEGKVLKECTEKEILDLKLNIKGGPSYKWIADSDGSYERFRKFLS